MLLTKHVLICTCTWLICELYFAVSTLTPRDCNDKLILTRCIATCIKYKTDIFYLSKYGLHALVAYILCIFTIMHTATH